MASNGQNLLSQVARLGEKNQQMRKAVDELSILNELARVISSTMNLDAVIDNIAKRSVRAVHAEQGIITTVDQHSSDSMKTLVRAMIDSREQQSFHLNHLSETHRNKSKKIVLTHISSYSSQLT